MVVDDFISKVIFLDTAPLIYFIEGNSKYQSSLNDIFKLNDLGKITFLTTSITLMEVLVKPFKEKRFDLVSQYRKILMQSKGIQLIEVSNSIAEEAANLRAKYLLKTPDAIQIATANLFAADYFLTNDKTLKTIDPHKIITLDEFIG